jgi:DNA-directed RNA polymerase specialized sigma24 family protein
MEENAKGSLMTIQLEAEELRLAERVAGRIASKWALVEQDDLTSHLYMWLVQNINAVQRWRTEEAGTGKLYVSLRREAAKYSAREQAARVGRPIQVGNFYTPELLDRALPFIFEDVPQTSVMENPVSGEPARVGNEFDQAVTIIADIRGHFYGLNRELKQVLEWRYRDGLTFEEIGELRGITKDGAKKQVERAVSRLADALAGERL